ncbi:hypothetical protein C1I98_24690 [Spongiactinospora gelatinilytica]|uniref:Uncharacterized protein n=1 Tax=Spongiactinospora gelatinilytica TaxID=2666298 RepID=A0A2W2GLS5_9ACTN|nr:hypothetical protein [Spongiactinospora gelatinilytica]PZG38108.1 hypothetical protein C1I98_24690 [Spongiactinospora gelatinilytica]
MPIRPSMIQRRLAEAGRIRLGHRVPTKNNKLRPEKLATFRFTSPDQQRIEEIAALYGGTAQPWEAQWEVITEADRIPINVPPNASREWMELWSGGGAVRRCDGDTEIKSGKPCLCRASGQMACKPHTRVSLLLPQVTGLGTWRIEPKSWDAAAELPDMVEFLSQVGRYVDADLVLSPRIKVKDGKTFNWWVPLLDPTNYTSGQLVEAARTGELATGRSGAGPALAGAARTAISAPGVALAADDLMMAARLAESTGELRTIWEHVKSEGVRLTREQRAEFDQLVIAAKQAAQSPQDAGTTRPEPADEVEIVDAEPVDEDDLGVLWMQIVAAWPGTTSELEVAFEGAMGALPGDAGPDEHRGFLDALKSGRIKPLKGAA